MADSPAEQDPEATTLGEHAASMADPGSARAAVNRGRFLAGATVGVGGVMRAVIAAPALALRARARVRDEAELRRRPRADEPLPGRQEQPVPRRDVRRARRATDRPRAPRGLHPATTATTRSRRSRTPACTSAARSGSSAVGFGCPCHGGQYDIEGRRIAGPPVRPAEPLRHQGRERPPDPRHAVRDGRQPAAGHQLKGPGQPVTGLLSFLYPPAPQ